MMAFQRKTISHAPDTAASKRGRPSKQDRLAKLTPYQIDRLTAEAGQPLDRMSLTDLEGLIKAVAKERGWQNLL